MKTKKPAHFLTLSLFANIVLISLIGLLFVFEASVTESLQLFAEPYFFLRRQTMWLILGSVGLLIGSQIPVKYYQKLAAPAYLGSLLLLLLLFVPGLGQTYNGARRWLLIGPTVIQPSEFIKLGLVLFFSSWLTKHQRLLPFLFLTGLPVLAVLAQPDLGSALIILSIAFGLYFLAGGQIKYILVATMIGVAVIGLTIASSQYRRDRVSTYLNPELDPLGTGFHIRQITLALGRGGLFGQGIGNSQQRHKFLPEPSTDSIFAITAEEVGFFGSLIILSLYGVLFYQLYRVARLQESTPFAYLLAGGILLWVAMQTLLNLAAVVALVPLTGVPLPLFSYGGSSLITILFALGIVIQLARKQ